MTNRSGRFHLALGLALISMLVAASIASAATFTTTSGATLSAGQKTEFKFTVTGQTITCKTANVDGTAPSASSSEVALGVSGGECKSEPLGASASVSGFGEVNQSGRCWVVAKASGGGELKCSGAGEVTVTALTCQVHIPAQSFASGATYTNGETGGKKDVTVGFEVTGIKGNHTDGFLCPFSSGGLSETGVLEGESTATATAGGTPVDGSHDA